MRKWLACLVVVLIAPLTQAEQKQTFTHFDAHYVVFPTTFLEPDIANRYNIVRAGDRALLNVSILSHEGSAIRGKITGSTKNLLGQIYAMKFHEVVEEEAVYYLAEFKHTDHDLLTFTIEIAVEGSTKETVSFQQKMFVKR